MTETVLRVTAVQRDMAEPDIELVGASPPVSTPQIGVVTITFRAPAGTWRINDDVRVNYEPLSLEKVAAEWAAVTPRQFAITLPAGQHEVHHNLGAKDVIVSPCIPDEVVDENTVRITLKAPTRVVVQA